MEVKLYRQLYKLIHGLAHPRTKRCQFNDQHVVLVLLWSIMNHRPRSWACDRQNWPKEIQMFNVISESRLSRRVRTMGVQQLKERALTAAADVFGVPLVKAIDSMPMTVGAYSHDADAKRGRVGAGMIARGYRLHALAHGRAIVRFVIAPLCDHDSIVAPKLIAQLQGYGYVPADNAYDTNPLHQQAAEHNHQLVSPPRLVNKGVRDLKYNCSERIRSLDLLDGPLKKAGEPNRFGRALYAQRQRIESGFAGLASQGLGPLPGWVRTPRRTAMWAAGKILISLVKLAKKQGLTAMTQ